jgi:hypothetical protein
VPSKKYRDDRRRSLLGADPAAGGRLERRLDEAAVEDAQHFRGEVGPECALGDAPAEKRAHRLGRPGVGVGVVGGPLTAAAGQHGVPVADGEESAGQASDGCISTVLDDPDAICLTQIWIDKAAHDTATRSDVVVSATGRVTALLAGPPEGSYGHVALRWDG